MEIFLFYTIPLVLSLMFLYILLRIQPVDVIFVTAAILVAFVPIINWPLCAVLFLINAFVILQKYLSRFSNHRSEIDLTKRD